MGAQLPESERAVAENKVMPYLIQLLGWKKELVSEYGRVPVQIGRQVVWADFVFYITKGNKRVPYLLVEVKRPQGSEMSDEHAEDQAESYSLILHAQFFCATDGKTYKYYITGDSQGNPIELAGPPPTPAVKYLNTEVMFPREVDYLVDKFITALREDPKFRRDMDCHVKASEVLRTQLFNKRIDIDSLSSSYLKQLLGDENIVMGKKPNVETIFKQDLNKIKMMLRYVRDTTDYPSDTIHRLIGSEFAIKGAKLFFVTQLLSAAHPDRYVAVHDNVSKALKELGITDIIVKPETANAYIFINDICKSLYRKKMEEKLKKEGFDHLKLWAVHQFLWHYYEYFRRTGTKWMAP